MLPDPPGGRQPLRRRAALPTAVALSALAGRAALRSRRSVLQANRDRWAPVIKETGMKLDA